MTSRKTVFIALSILTILALAGLALALSSDGSTSSTATAADQAGASTDPATSTSDGTDASTTASDDTTSSEPAQEQADSTSPTSTPAFEQAGTEIVPGAGSPTNPGPDDPIGTLDDQHPVPAGLGLVSLPSQPASPAISGAGNLAVAPSCSHQCITKGVAYPRGFGARLVVETELPAHIFLSAVADLDHNGSYETHYQTWSGNGVQSFGWNLDHLEPGETYHVMASATDGYDHTAYVWGEFTTLSHRDVSVQFGQSSVSGGHGDINYNTWYFGLGGPLTEITPGATAPILFGQQPRHADVELWWLRGWHEKVCEAWVLGEDAWPQGHDGGSCVSWNSTHLDNVDLDTIPAGHSHWTQTTVGLTLHPNSQDGQALPPGYGDPYWFDYSVPVTLTVNYS